MFDRISSFSMDIKDPDCPEDTSPIIRSINVDTELLIFKTNGIYRLLTAETIDPKKQHSETRHTYEKLYSVGTTTVYIARMILQFESIITFVAHDQTEINRLISFLWNANKLLLNCYCLTQFIYDQTLLLLPKCNEIIKNEKRSIYISPLPKVPDLENRVSSFLSNAKLFLIESFRVLNIFLGMPISDRSEAHFDKHLKWAEANLGRDHDLPNVLNQDMDWIRFIAACRNAIEHPGDGQTLQIRNISLVPGNKFTSPAWAYDLSKKLNKKSDYTDLIYDLDAMLNNLFYFFEEILLLTIKEKLKDNKLLILYKIEDNDIREECPIQYSITLNKEFLEMGKDER